VASRVVLSSMELVSVYVYPYMSRCRDIVVVLSIGFIDVIKFYLCSNYYHCFHVN
jgi:hypothetical protein